MKKILMISLLALLALLLILQPVLAGMSSPGLQLMDWLPAADWFRRDRK